jgi:Ca2+:H+ antiporter
LAENIKRDFNRLGRHQATPAQQHTMPAPSNGRLYHEQTPLIGRTQNYEGESRVKTFPKHVLHLTYATLTSNYVNVFLIFVPIGILAGILGWNPTAVFVLNFIAIIPLAALLSFATEELSAKLGQTLGGLMNATFGNAVELIVSLRLINYAVNDC